jgi:two-component system cell cycle sensor histidine kinase/response regulator CckA
MSIAVHLVVSTTPPAGQGYGTILVVDDEESVLFMVKKMLERMGFSVEAVPGGREAVQQFGARPDEFACVLLDLTMPVFDGSRTLGELKRIRPDVKVILSSGGSRQDVLDEFAGRGISGFIQKPYSAAALAEVLRGVLGSPSP